VRLGVRIEPGNGGVVVNGVEADSAAARAGVREGDLIVAVDGEAVRKPVDLIRRIRAHHPGDHASLGVARGTETLTIDVSWPP